MEPQAIELGISSTDYWNMTFKEIMLQCEAYKKIRERETKEKAAFDYNMIQGMMFAFNDPKNMPKAEKLYPVLAEEKEEVKKVEPQKPYVQETDQAVFLAMAKNVKNFNKNKEQ